MASTREAATQLRTYPAFPAAPHRGGGEPVLFIAFFLRNPRGGGLTVRRSLPSRSRYQRATTNIQSTYERPTMARCTPEQAIRRRAWRQDATPGAAWVRSPAAGREWTPPGGRRRHPPDAGPDGPDPARCAAAR